MLKYMLEEMKRHWELPIPFSVDQERPGTLD